VWITIGKYTKYVANYRKGDIISVPRRERIIMQKLKENDIVSYLTIKKIFRKSQRIGKPRTHCECECVCGNIVVRRMDHLVAENSQIKSCGCKHPRTYVGDTSVLWRGYGEISGQFIAHIKHKARIRNLLFKLTGNFLWNLFIKQNRRCALTGVLLKFAPTNKPKKESRETTASLDRIDSAKGYVADNVQWVHKYVNIMKREISEDKFFKICRLVVKHQTSKVALTTPRNNGRV
jgi:hypothetical protein